MVQQSNSRFSSLAADRLSAAWSCCARAHSLTSPVKTRVWGCPPSPSGRPSRRGRRERGTATGSTACAYKTVPGRTKWLSRDPIADIASPSLLSFGRWAGPGAPGAAELVEGPNVYLFVRNNSVIYADAWGLQCGSGWSEKPIPEEPFPGFDFTQPCENHDACYGRCGAEKRDCDDQFLSDMKQACRDSTAASPLLCYVFAHIYYGAVKSLGEKAYRDAQAKCPPRLCPPPQIVPRDGYYPWP